MSRYEIIADGVLVAVANSFEQAIDYFDAVCSSEDYEHVEMHRNDV